MSRFHPNAGIAPHTDANFLTFLAQSDVPGLQVRMPSGDWLDVPYVPGSYAVNTGDTMVRWTNGRFEVVIAAGDVKLRHVARDPRCILLVF